MKAAVLRNINQPLEIEDVRISEPTSNEVVVQTKAAGICHSDYHFIVGDIDIPKPIILGHEAAGIVKAVGDKVTSVSPGEAVVVCAALHCRECDFCLSGKPVLCPRIGMNRKPTESSRLYTSHSVESPVGQMASIGAFAEEMLVHENACISVNDAALSWAELALMSCSVLTGLGAVFRTAKVKSGSVVCVIGCGGVGLNCIQGARIAGAKKIIAVDTSQQKLDYASQFGATDTVLADGLDVVKAVRDIVNGVDYAFEAVGLPDTIRQSFNILAPGGLAVVIGISPTGTKVELDIEGFSRFERRIYGSRMGSSDFHSDIPYYLYLVREQELQISPLVTSCYSLSGINDGFNAMTKGDIARGVILFDG